MTAAEHARGPSNNLGCRPLTAHGVRFFCTLVLSIDSLTMIPKTLTEKKGLSEYLPADQPPVQSRR